MCDHSSRAARLGRQPFLDRNRLFETSRRPPRTCDLRTQPATTRRARSRRLSPQDPRQSAQALVKQLHVLPISPGTSKPFHPTSVFANPAPSFRQSSRRISLAAGDASSPFGGDARPPAIHNQVRYLCPWRGSCVRCFAAPVTHRPTTSRTGDRNVTLETYSASRSLGPDTPRQQFLTHAGPQARLYTPRF
jgi:hypothetical protein